MSVQLRITTVFAIPACILLAERITGEGFRWQGFYIVNVLLLLPFFYKIGGGIPKRAKEGEKQRNG